LRRALHAGLAVVVRFCIFAKLDVLAKVVTPPRFASNTELLSDAQAIRDKVAPYRQALLDAGLPAQVLDDLPAQIVGLAAARDAKDAAQRNFTAAGKDLEAALAAGDGGIEVLHNILKATPQAHPNAVTKLAVAKRVGPRVKDDPQAQTAPAPTPATDTPPKAVA
jgi:hypothetical protein